MNHIYFTALRDGAGLAAEIAAMLGPDGAEPHVYIVEPSGAFEDEAEHQLAVIAKKGTSDPVIDGDACVMTDAAVGEGTYTFSTDSAAVAIGEYKLEFKATNGANVQYFPTNRTIPPLDAKSCTNARARSSRTSVFSRSMM